MLLCIIYIYKTHFLSIHDFANYYFGAYFLKEGLFTTDIYFPYYFNKNIADLGYQNIFVSYAPNTPFLAILFYPLTFLKLTTAKLIFNILSSGLFLFSVTRLLNYFKIKKEYIILLPILFFIPLKNNLLFGQVYFLLFFFLSEGFLAYQKKQFKTMAIFWTLAIFLKVFPILLTLFLLFKKEFKALRYLIFFSAILLLISITINGLEVWQFYFIKVLPRASSGEIAGEFVDNYQSIFMFLKRLLVYDAVYNSDAIWHQPQLFKAVLIFIKVFLIGIGYYVTTKSKNNIFTVSLWLLISVLLSPYGSTYTFILLLFLYVYLVKLVGVKRRNILLILLFIIGNNVKISNTGFPLNYMRLLVLIGFIILLLWRFKAYIKFTEILIIAFIVGVLNYFTLQNKSKSTKLIAQKTPILMYKYQVINNKLNYFYWNEKGQNRKETNVVIKKINTKDVTIKNNQVYYKNKQITNTKSNKKQVYLLNEKQVIYLSDAKRGIGFYELRQIRINE